VNVLKNYGKNENEELLIYSEFMEIFEHHPNILDSSKSVFARDALQNIYSENLPKRFLSFSHFSMLRPLIFACECFQVIATACGALLIAFKCFQVLVSACNCKYSACQCLYGLIIACKYL